MVHAYSETLLFNQKECAINTGNDMGTPQRHCAVCNHTDCMIPFILHDSIIQHSGEGSRAAQKTGGRLTEEETGAA